MNAIRRIGQSSDLEIREMLSTRSNGDEVKEVEIQLAKIEKRMQKQIEAYEHDLISAADLKMARERIDKERAKLEEHLQALKSRTVDTQELRNQIEKQLEDISSTDRLKSKKSMALLIDSIIVEAPNVQIVWRI